ncbi:MAG: DegV family protein, partial [Oscillospiraceae bacterium]
DSTTDLTKELVQELNIDVIPLEFTIEEKVYENNLINPQISSKDFYDKLRNGIASVTSQINATRYIDFFTPYLEKGMDILYLCFSSGLSGTYHSSVMACEELQEKYPDRKIITIDTFAASMGEGLLAWYAVSKKKSGQTINEVAQWILDYRDHLAHWFTVDDLNHLKRGGRVSGAAAAFGTLLNIKPVMHVDNGGHLIPVYKVRGRRQSFDKMIDIMDKTFDKSIKQMIFISHGDALEEAKYIEKMVREKFAKNILDVKIGDIGPVIGTHSGPGTLALFFIGSEK